MRNRIAIEPTEEPVTLAEMRLQLGITQATDTARDSIITARIKAARRVAENFTSRAFVTQTWDLYADSFEDVFDLLANLQSVTFVKYTDTDGVLRTMDAADYQVDAVNHRILPAYGDAWPSTRAVANAVQIRYVCGYGLSAAVPQDIKEALKFIIGHWENFQGGIEGGVTMTRIPYAVEHLLWPYRDLRGVL
jgi:uncharacterized phiE125 gp8 family phage protein